MERPPGVDPFVQQPATPAAPATPAIPPQRRNCTTCGRSIGWDANVCPYCGHDYRTPIGPPPKPSSSKPIIAGILIIIAALLALAMGSFMLMVDESFFNDVDLTSVTDAGYSISEIVDMMNSCGIIIVIFGIIGLIGGVLAAAKKHYMLAMIGAIIALLGIGFVIGSVLALIGIILLALSKEEFD